MHTRVLKQKNKNGTTREYLCLMKSYRDENGKPRSKMIANLGRMDTEMTPNKVDILMKHLEKHANQATITNILKDLKSKASKVYGEIQIHRKVFKDLGIKEALKKKLEKTEKQIDYVEAIFMAVSNRLSEPSSKKGASEWKDRVYEPKWEQLELQHVYRGMDFLIDQKDEVECELFDKTRDLFSSNVSVAMFDTTNISYWGKGEDPIFQRGRAKNKRYDLKQLVVGLVMDKDGTPLGHEVWPGNMSDQPAFKEVISKIKKKFLIEKVILVCDRGMVSEESISFLEKENYEYILGVKMRSLSSIRQKILLCENGFEQTGVGSRLAKEMTEGELNELELKEKRAEKIAKGIKAKPLDDEKIKEYKNTPKGKRRWITCLNPLLAIEDKQKREYFRQILENKVEFNTAKEWLVKNGYKKYVNISDFSIQLDENRLDQDALYDGKWILTTNTTLPIESTIRAYKDLAKIERHFRTLKSEIELGPIRHWTERRVRAHVFICFLALQIQTFISKKLKEHDSELSYREVMTDVAQIRANIFELKGKRYIQRTEFQGLAHHAFRVTGTKIPPEFLETPDS